MPQGTDGPRSDRRPSGKRIQAKLDAAKAMTFAACAERCIASHKAGWRDPKHAAQWPATLGTYVYPVFESLPVQAASLPISPLYILGCGVIGLVALSLLTDYTNRDVSQKYEGVEADSNWRCGETVPRVPPADSLVEEGGFEPSVRWNRNLGGGAVSESVVLPPGDRGVRGHDVERDVRARLDRRVVNRGIKREPAEALEELRLDRLSFSDVPPLAMRRWRR